MPEGHTIHRLARRLRRDLGGRVVVSSSPQGRFSAGAAEVDGTELTGVDAAGKHLFLRFGDRTVHVHLGLFGRFRRVTGSEAAPPTENTRWVLGSDAIEWRLSGPMACELADPGTEDDIRSRLGPDPLAGDDGGAFVDHLARTRRPIAQVLLDQSVVAGIGNVYRAEALFVAGIDPHRPASDIAPTDAWSVWHVAARQLATGERLGRIVTVDPATVGVESPSDVPRGERLLVYGRGGLPCRRCGTAIASGDVGGRTTWWCPSCQS